MRAGPVHPVPLRRPAAAVKAPAAKAARRAPPRDRGALKKAAEEAAEAEASQRGEKGSPKLADSRRRWSGERLRSIKTDPCIQN